MEDQQMKNNASDEQLNATGEVTDNQPQWCFDWIPEDLFAGGKEKAVAVKGAVWNSGENITVSFLDGDPVIQERVKKAALKWVAPGMANLKLIFRTDTNKTDIRISFKFPGSWSLVGSACRKQTDLTKPTMNYGWLKLNTPDENLERVVLHEFGHALGLTHEHLHPAHGIQWNKDKIYKDLSGPPNNWTTQIIDNNMFKVYSKTETNFTQFDKDSIMLYPIPPEWTLNGFSVGLNSKLSSTDINFIRQLYP